MDDDEPGAQGIASQGAAGTATLVEVQPITADAASGLPERWLACLVVEGFRTTDGRAIAVGALSWRALPIPLSACFSDEGGHYGSVVVGNIETVTREGARIMATGSFHLTNADGTPDDDGRKAAGMCADQVLRFVSVDMEIIDAASIETEDDYYYEILNGRIGKATMVSMPAFPQACIVPEGMTIPEPEPLGEVEPADKPMLIASATSAGTEIDLHAPPSEWFENPVLTGLTHFTVTEQGRVFGHLAGWGVPHRGIQGRTVYAPHSPSGYRHYATGRRKLDNDEWATTGPITMGIGHAAGGLKLASAAAHYDDTNYGKADVCVGEDEFGIWFAGAVRPGITIDDFLVMNASDVSGDWRPTNEGHELVAALVVNCAGFLITASILASASYASVGHATFTQYEHLGEEGAIVAAGLVRREDPIKRLEREIATIRAAISPLMPLAAATLDERIGATL